MKVLRFTPSLLRIVVIVVCCAFLSCFGKSSSVLTGGTSIEAVPDSGTSVAAETGSAATSEGSGEDSGTTETSSSGTEESTGTDPSGSGENDVQAVIPAPSLIDHVIVSEYAVSGDTVAVIQVSGLDSSYDGDSFVIMLVPAASVASRQNVSGHGFLAYAWSFLVPQARADATNNPCLSGDALVTCVTISGGAIPDTEITVYEPGDTFTFSIYDPDTDAVVTEETEITATSNLIYWGNTPVGSGAATKSSDTVFQVDSAGHVAAVTYSSSESRFALNTGADDSDLNYGTVSASSAPDMDITEIDYFSSSSLLYATFASATAYVIETYGDDGETLTFAMSVSSDFCDAAANCLVQDVKLSFGGETPYFSARDLSSTTPVMTQADDLFSIDSSANPDSFTPFEFGTEFSKTDAFDVREDSSLPLVNGLALFQDRSGSVFAHVYLEQSGGGAVATYGGNATVSDWTAAESDLLLDAAILRSYSAADTTTPGSAVLVKSDGLRWAEYSFDSAGTTASFQFTGTALSACQTASATAVDVDYDATRSKAFVLCNAGDSSSSADDYVSEVDLAAGSLTRSLPLSTVLGETTSDIDPVTIQYVAPVGASSSYLVVGSRSLQSAVIVELE